MKMVRCISRRWLNKNQYIAEMEEPKCLVIVTVNDKGDPVRWAIFGMNGKEKEQ